MRVGLIIATRPLEEAEMDMLTFELDLTFKGDTGYST